MTTKKKHYGNVRVLKIYPKEDVHESVGSPLRPEDAEQLATYLLKASREEKVIDITGHRKTGHRKTVRATV